MSFSTRLKTLEARLGNAARRCHTCGFPDTQVRAFIDDTPEAELPFCTDCGRPITLDGRPLADGAVKRIILHPANP